MSQHSIVFGGGCFWCTEAVFRRLNGVISVTPGYAGGNIANPTYYQVAGGDTGHAEVVKVDFDSEIIDLETLLSVFFSTHDPTTPDRQGYDVGSEYRSIILYTDENQKERIQTFINALQKDKIFSGKIVTQVERLQDFYEAEDDHKAYYEKNKDARYCQLIIDPKIAKLRASFAHLLKEE